MPLVDVLFDPTRIGKRVIGLEITQSAPMVLSVSAGSLTLLQTGVAYDLSSAVDIDFTGVPDATDVKRVQMNFVFNGTTGEVWVDRILLNGLHRPAAVPVGSTLLIDLGWFNLAANETDLDNGDIFRRVWV